MWARASPELTNGRIVLAITQPVVEALTIVGLTPKASEMAAMGSPSSTYWPSLTCYVGQSAAPGPHPPRASNEPGVAPTRQSGVDHPQTAQRAHHADHSSLDGVLVEPMGLSGLVQKDLLATLLGGLT